ncbi:histidine kinase [Pedobacter aquatilis]|uniref:sensor histidine kinase n=1 Tax=Pedobacter aquatilis TaxID=351343 RepID=UPI0025B4B590|nr:histidine kinase [Pedobacter aquatilis]MDN3588049.1 histidine kinase [Pedobacter aquatilis]
MKGFLSKLHLPLDKVFIVNLIVWTAFIFIEVFVAGAVRDNFSSMPYYVLFYILNISIFYIHGELVMPLSRRPDVVRTARFILVLFSEALLYLGGAIIVGLILTHVFAEPRMNPFPLKYKYVAIVGYRALFFMAFATGYYFLKEHLKEKDIKIANAVEFGNLQTQLLRSEKDYLRAQINPHLLFNTLDFIKAVSKTNPEQAGEAIDCLSEIMDYALETNKKDFVPVVKEMEQVEYIIRLSMLRNANRLHLNIKKNIENADATIPPIILLTLVENIFKHGNLKDENQVATIELFTDDKYIIFNTSNLIANPLPTKKKGTGLKNVSERLKHSYQLRHSFFYAEQGNVFTTELRIDF